MTWCGIHGLGSGYMGLVLDAWAWCGMHGLGAGGMGLVREAWAWCGMHGLGAGCMGLVRDGAGGLDAFDSVCSLYSQAHEHGHFWDTEKVF